VNDRTLRVFTFVDVGNVFGDSENQDEMWPQPVWAWLISSPLLAFAQPVRKQAGDKFKIAISNWNLFLILFYLI
jgi:outer membrane protein insertion porin family